MLLCLTIRDFAIVAELELGFESGFTVLTGETGAGKSLLIDALQFVLGERADAHSVREGAARAEVSAVFAVGAEVALWLRSAGLEGSEGEPGEQQTVLVRRSLDTSARSRGFINGSAVTLAQLRALGELLLDVHGQHEHQLLLRAAAQLHLLDAHGGLRAQARLVAAAHADWVGARAAHAQAQAEHAQAQAQRAQLEALALDLAELAPQEGEWDSVEAEQRRLAHAGALIEGARAALDALAEGGDEALQGRLARIEARLAPLRQHDASLAPALTALANAAIEVEEAVRALNHYVDACDLDEGRRAQIEERIAALHAAGRKWRCAPGTLPALQAHTRARLEALAQSGDLEQLWARQTQAQARYREAAEALTRGRQAAAARMGQEVSAAMQGLGMGGGRFEVALVATEPGAEGLEKAEFQVAAHAGGALRPLARVASGGELSRIGLAIAVIAAQANPVPTLIFDEVDAGIGGPVAAIVGRLLRELGAARQVFCVTHLPQVAACGEHHIAVTKSTAPDGRPLSHTALLDAGARVQEIARMLGGAQITALTQRHAREMLAQN